MSPISYEELDRRRDAKSAADDHFAILVFSWFAVWCACSWLLGPIALVGLLAPLALLVWAYLR